MSVKKTVADLSHITGTILMVGGGVGLFLMAVVGTLAVDLVLLTYARKRGDAFLTGFALGSLMTRQYWGPLFATSIVTTGIAVILSIALGVSGVGAALLAGWAAAALTFAAGAALHALGDSLEQSPPSFNPTPRMSMSF